MNPLLNKEIRLSASVLSFIFIVFAAMTMVPGYPILCGAFFITLGLFHSFQNSREANDIVFSALLPVAKHDVVKGKFMFSVMIEMAGFLIMVILTVIRMTVLADSNIYQQNVMMNANLFYLGMVLAVYGLFNLLFIGGFFKTAYKLSPFFTYTAAALIAIGIAEALHHIPGLETVNAFGFNDLALQFCLLLAGIVVFAALTFISYRKACKDFERIDL